jgi:hypothetical protein
MLPGDINPHMMLRGLMLLQENGESIEELLPRGSIRHSVARAFTRLSYALWRDRVELKNKISELSQANHLLEARILEVERQLATLTITTE